MTPQHTKPNQFLLLVIYSAAILLLGVWFFAQGKSAAAATIYCDKAQSCKSDGVCSPTPPNTSACTGPNPSCTNIGFTDCLGVDSCTDGDVCEPGCVSNQGSSCTSSANNCGNTNTGTISCDGTCSASAPADEVIGGACTSSANNCGATNSGTIVCGGTCSATQPADGTVVNGGWSAWSACSGGTQTRTCDSPAPSCGGAACSGASSQSCTSSIACSSNSDCNDSNVCTTDSCNSPGTTSSSCSNTNNPVNGGWSDWGACSSSGTQTRTCNNPTPACGGTGCTGSASQSCTSTISCSSDSACNDNDTCTTDYCNSPGTTSSSCSNVSYPVNGGWSAWSACLNGTQTRACNSPAPSCGGANCTGSSSQSCSSGGATCGNGITEGSEQCDLGDANNGNGNGVCPKTCSSSCTVNSCGSCTDFTQCSDNNDCTSDICNSSGQCQNPPSCYSCNYQPLNPVGSQYICSSIAQSQGYSATSTCASSCGSSGDPKCDDGVCYPTPPNGCTISAGTGTIDNECIETNSGANHYYKTTYTNASQTCNGKKYVTSSGSCIEQNCAETSTYTGTYTSPVLEGGCSGGTSGADPPLPVTGPVCGNKALETGEQCDDGNFTSNDGCSSACQLENVMFISSAPTSQDVCRGSGVSYAITAAYTGASITNAKFTVSGCPAGATCAFSGGSGSSITAPFNAQKQANATLVITTTSSAAYQANTVNVKAEDNACAGQASCLSANTNIALNVLNCVTPQADLYVNPLSFAFNAISGSSTPLAQDETIKNNGLSGSVLNWTWNYTPGKPATWCKLVNSSGIDIPINTGGSLSSGQSVTAKVAVSAPSNAGSFSDCGIRIQDPNATNSPKDVSITYNVQPTNVANLTASLAACPSRNITLSWTPGNSGSSLKTYNIYRNTANSAPAVTYASGITTTNWTDTSTVVGQTYYYWVEAVSGGQVSPNKVASSPPSIIVSTCPGIIQVRWNKDGTDGGMSTYSTGGYNWTGPTPYTCTGNTCIIGKDHVNITPGAYTFTYTGNGTPSGTVKAASFITPATTQTLPSGGVITFTANFVSPSKPDLIVENLAVNPASPTPGQTLSFTGQVRNQGQAGAGGTSQTSLKIDRDNNGTWDVLPANLTTGNLSVAGTEIETWSNAWTNAPAGTHKMEVCADATSLRTESNETNNCLSQIFTVTQQTSPPPGNGPNNPCVENGTGVCGSSPPNQGGGGSVVCETVRIAWTDNSTNETGFYVYRNSTGNPPVVGERIATLPANTTTYTHTPPNTNPYYYFVSAYNAGGESAKIPADNNPVSSLDCVANLSTSDKDITALEGLIFTPSACNGAYESTPAAVKFLETDLVSFRLNICNNSPTSQNDATSVVVTDYLTNLVQPPSGWQAQLCTPGGSCSNITPAVSGTAPNQTLTFTLGTVPQGESRYITFNAQLAAASSPASRFNNRAVIDYIKDDAGTPGSRPASVPWLPYYSSKGAPERGEIAPQ